MMARALALNGAKKVFVIGRREDSLRRTVASVEGSVSEGTIVPLVGDVTSKGSLSACVESVKAQVPYIDVLIANSGILGPPFTTTNAKTKEPLPLEQLAANMWESDPDAINSTYAVNLTGVHFTVAAFLPLLAAANAHRSEPPAAENFRPRPQIITSSSVGGFRRRPFHNLCYGASKAGLVHMTKRLATALVPYDIRPNVLALGLWLTEGTVDIFDAMGKTTTHSVEGTWPRSMIPATRTGDEQDMAGVILWLCSRAGAYINGNVVVSDGGSLGVFPSSY